MKLLLSLIFCLASIVFVNSAYAGAANAPQDEILQNGDGKFKIDIPGAPTASKNIQSIQVEDLTIDVRETTCSADWDWRKYEPGSAHFGKITITSKVSKSSKELQQWFMDASIGKNVRKDITVQILKRDGSVARSWILMDTFPIKYDPGDYSPNSSVRTETIVVKVGHVEFADNGNQSTSPSKNVDDDDSSETRSMKKEKDDVVVTKGFRIEVSGPSGGKQEDNAWESATGGAIVLQLPLLEFDTIPQREQIETCVNTLGHKFVDEIILRGPMTSSRTWIGQNINDVVTGKFSRFDLSIVEINKDGSDGKKYTYQNCFLVRYVYPVLSADGTGNLYEEVHIKPERLELQ